MRQAGRFAGVCGLLLLAVMGAGTAFAASHLWTIEEVYSNADGSIQFVEMYNCCASNESNLIGKDVRSTAHAYFFPGNLPPNSTTDKHILLATSGFAALPGAPAPDHIIPANFFSLVADEVRWWDYVMPDSELHFTAGQLPTNGFHSLNQLGNGSGATAPATPTNFAGATFAPPGVGNLTVAKIPGSPSGSRLVLDADETACLGASNFHIVYGWGSGLSDANPVYSIQPASVGQCGIFSLPRTWNNVPDPAVDSSRFLWFLVVATDGQSTEGSWGRASDGAERMGPAAGGSSGQCGITAKSPVNTCGL
jgi:hypothetical protein